MSLWSVFLLSSLMSWGGEPKSEAKPLTLYTARNQDLITPVLKAYKQHSGEDIQVVTGQAGSLVQKLLREGKKSPADLLMTVDAGYLVQAADKGLLLPLKPSYITHVPQELRAPEHLWVGVSLRARTLFYNSDKVKSSELSSYEALAQPQWKGRLCLRTSRKVYNQSLVAGLLERHTQDKVEAMVKGWVRNLARPVFTSDTQLLEAIDKGLCDVGIANTYYLARLQSEGQAQNVKPFWPSLDKGGVHVNISGVGVVKTSPQKERALNFIKWLLSDEAQKIFADANHEYPVVDAVKPTDIVKSWGTFQRDPTPLTKVGRRQREAVMLMDKARYL